MKYNLKGGCTRFEVEHISCNLLLYIGKHDKNGGNFTALKSTLEYHSL